MSQTVESQTEDGSDETSIAETLINELSFATELIQSLSESDLENMTDSELVDVRTELKELESAVETARKDQADSVLENRVEPGERLHGLKRVKSHNKYVEDDVGTVIMRAVSQEINYTDFVSLDASTLASDYPDLAEIGRHEYTYFV